ncbi:MAG: hypothetical protein WBW14_29030 [Candidatus Acidiferrum sp.]
MRIPYQFRDVVLAALLLSCLAKVATAQQSAQQLDLPTLSPAVHSALCPEVMCVHCIVPQWDRGYILHLEIDKESAVVTMYDRDGKKVLEARPEPPDAAKVSLSAAASTHAGGRNSRGWRRCHDGWVHPRIHRRFSPHQVCEASDGSVWTLGYALDYRDSPDADKNALRHYSFEKGLLEGLVPLDSISKSRDATLNVNSVGEVFFAVARTVFRFSSAPLPSTSKWMPPMR